MQALFLCDSSPATKAVFSGRRGQPGACPQEAASLDKEAGLLLAQAGSSRGRAVMGVDRGTCSDWKGGRWGAIAGQGVSWAMAGVGKQVKCVARPGRRPLALGAQSPREQSQCRGQCGLLELCIEWVRLG